MLPLWTKYTKPTICYGRSRMRTVQNKIVLEYHLMQKGRPEHTNSIFRNIFKPYRTYIRAAIQIRARLCVYCVNMNITLPLNPPGRIFSVHIALCVFSLINDWIEYSQRCDIYWGVRACRFIQNSKNIIQNKGPLAASFFERQTANETR